MYSPKSGLEEQTIEHADGFDEFSVDERKRHAFHLAMRGHSPKKIATMIGVSVATVRSYLKEYREVVRGQAEKINRHDYVAEVCTHYDMMYAEAWSNYERAKTDMAKGRWMAAMLKIMREKRSALHDLGVVKKEAERVEFGLDVEVNQNIGVGLSGSIDRQQLDALASLLLAPSMGLSAEEVAVMRGRPLQLAEQSGHGMIDINSTFGQEGREPVVEPFDLQDFDLS